MSDYGRTVIVLVTTLLVLSCGNDGIPRADGEGDGEAPTGCFACAYHQGETLAVGRCREDSTMYTYRLTLDWWADAADGEGIDSVFFWIPSISTLWGDSLGCLSYTFMHFPRKGRREGNHWSFTDSAYGFLAHDEFFGIHVAREFMPDSLAWARVFYGDDAFVLFDTEPGPE
jgi:hypothetical protein